MLTTSFPVLDFLTCDRSEETAEYFCISEPELEFGSGFDLAAIAFRTALTELYTTVWRVSLIMRSIRVRKVMILRQHWRLLACSMKVSLRTGGRFLVGELLRRSFEEIKF